RINQFQYISLQHLSTSFFYFLSLHDALPISTLIFTSFSSSNFLIASNIPLDYSTSSQTSKSYSSFLLPFSFFSASFSLFSSGPQDRKSTRLNSSHVSI